MVGENCLGLSRLKIIIIKKSMFSKLFKALNFGASLKCPPLCRWRNQISHYLVSLDSTWTAPPTQPPDLAAAFMNRQQCGHLLERDYGRSTFYTCPFFFYLKYKKMPKEVRGRRPVEKNLISSRRENWTILQTGDKPITPSPIVTSWKIRWIFELGFDVT